MKCGDSGFVYDAVDSSLDTFIFSGHFFLRRGSRHDGGH